MFQREDIHIDPDFELHFGRKELFDSCPTVIGTVSFRLVDTDALNKLGDEVRMKLGRKPAYCYDKNGEIDLSCWYDFHYGINTFCGLDNYIVGEVLNSADTADEMFTIFLSNDEKQQIRGWINDELIRIYGRSYRELLEEAQKEALE